MADPAALDHWLRSFVGANGAVAGTAHQLTGDALELKAHVNIPPKVVEITRSIPRGKGMAGLAWDRDQPVSTCNLKEDKTGDVRPGARAVDASAAVALPIHGADGGLRGVIGIAFAGERTMAEDELSRLSAEAERAPL
ncbi:MAG TPA: GAF domain-containing protein [Thermoanaerobaculia bacterium]|nr:GAF domain-containing protein [Thermoanaerobaculia bacterium]